MKHEWRKEEKEIYLPKEKPVVLELGPMKYITVSGKGDPNKEGFKTDIKKLYSVAYGIRMMPKSGFTPPGYFEYTVYPLEGIWDVAQTEGTFEYIAGKTDKDKLIYKIMLRQPDFVTDEVYCIALQKAVEKNSDLDYSGVNFEEITEGRVLQMLHVGKYDDEKRTSDIMTEAVEKLGLKRRSFTHKEIYISDPFKTEPDKLKTVLRYFLE